MSNNNNNNNSNVIEFSCSAVIVRSRVSASTSVDIEHLSAALHADVLQRIAAVAVKKYADYG